MTKAKRKLTPSSEQFISVCGSVRLQLVEENESFLVFNPAQSKKLIDELLMSAAFMTQ